MRKVFAVLMLCSGVAAAGPKVQWLAQVDQGKEVKLNRRTVQYFHVVAPTPILTARLNMEIDESAALIGTAEDDGRTLDIGCTPGLLTTVFASWTCSGLATSSNGSAQYTAAASFLIQGDDMIPISATTLFGKDFPAKATKLAGKTSSGSACTPDPSWGLDINNETVTFRDDEQTCVVEWDVLLPLLPKDSPLRQLVGENVQAIDPAPDNPKAGWAKARPRFAAEGGGVTDRATDLVWAATDNGADIDVAGAKKFAADYRGGGFSDWRLPTESELEEVSEAGAAHRDKTDCTKGKNALLLTSLVKLSCGLAWSSTTSGSGNVGFGFISGSPRVSKRTEKTNYRALVVRDPRPKKK